MNTFSRTSVRPTIVALARPHKNNRDEDKPAAKYCFRATVRVIDTHHDRPFGIFTAYDTNVGIGAVVENACDIFRNTVMPERLECEVSEVVLHRECPVEITSEIHFARIVDVDSQ